MRCLVKHICDVRLCCYNGHMLEQPQSTPIIPEQDPAELEPGLLAVFRLMMGLYAGFAAIGLTGTFFQRL